MKCEFCGIELTSKIYKIHVGICRERHATKEPIKTATKKEELKAVEPDPKIQRGLMKAELDAKGISYHANAKNDYLMKLINESKEAV